jgi:hypothetical protein
MTTKINLSNIDSEQDYSSLATTLFAKANVAANIANTALATASTILKVTSIVYPGDDTAADTAGGQTITLTGTGFVSGASVLLNGSAVGVVSVANSTTLTFTSPSANAGSYVIYIVNPDGGTAISIPGIQYSGTPTWTTAAGSLGSLYETAAFGNTVVATGDTVTYSLQSGTLPPGATFSSNGTITGTSSTLSSPTTYTFTVRATDAQNQDTDRSFSITINPDAVTWSSPTTNTSYTLLPNVAMSNISLVATSAAGANIFYSANTLPTGVSLSGNTIFGTPTVTDETRTSLVTATANTTSESSSLYNYNSAVGNSTTNVSLNTWTHIAVTRVGTTLTYYINGVASGTGTSSANISDTAVQVMRGFGGITNSPIGYISNLRTVVGTAVYTGNFTPSTTPLTAISGTSLLTCQSNRFKDNSTNNFTITRNGDVSVQRFSPFSPTAAYSAATIGGSGYFNGTTDYISIPYAGDPSTNFGGTLQHLLLTSKKFLPKA